MPNNSHPARTNARTFPRNYGGNDHSPINRLIDCVFHPLALPIFGIPTSSDRMMDLLFGRLHVCMGISIPMLVDECRKAGMIVRTPNKGERQAMQKGMDGAILHEGKPFVVERDGKSMILADGLFVRAMFHFQNPISLISTLLDNMDLSPE